MKMFNKDMYFASLRYYGLPLNYNRTFKVHSFIDTKTGEIATTLRSCSVPTESSKGVGTWVQINAPREDAAFSVQRTPGQKRYPKKAKNADIGCLANVSLDFEYPQEPGRAYRVGMALSAYLEQRGLAEPDLPVEDSGAGCHIVLPLPSITNMQQTDAERWNEAVRAIVKKYIEPEFNRLCKEEGIQMDLSGFDISRVLSVPGTWRPTNPEKPDCEALKHGYLRQWLAPYTDGHYPERHESTKLAEMIREEYTRIESPIAASLPLVASHTSFEASTWLSTYASSHFSSDRSGLFQGLVNATYRKYDEDMVFTLKEDINRLSGEKYNGRLDEEITRSLDKAKQTPKDTPWQTIPLPRTSMQENTQEIDLCTFDADDSGNADALNALYGKEFLYCPSVGWFYYTGTHWKLDSDAALVRQRAIETLRARRHAAIDAEKEAIVKCTKADERRVNGCINLFRIYITVEFETFDCHPDKLNCQNGVLDLRTGILETHSRIQRFTYCVPVEYKPDAYCQEWLDYLAGVVGGGQEVLDYLQMALGYSLTGHTREEILFYLYGPPRSGKGTIAEVFMALLPNPLSTMVDFNSFTARREGDVSNFDLAPLKPSRLIFASESNSSQSLNPAKIKQLTGGDHIRACFKHKDFFDYRPQFKVWLMSNHTVNGDPEDDALWGRVRVIEFPNSFLNKEDKTKKSRLKETDALEATLTWAVVGVMKWYGLGAQGLTTPNSIALVTQSQRNELDYVQQWLDTCTEGYEGGWVANEEVIASYTAWCKENNVQYVKGPKALAQSLKVKGYEPGQVKKVGGKTKRGVGGLHIYTNEIEV